MLYHLTLPVFKAFDHLFGGSKDSYSTHVKLFRLYADKFFFHHYGQFEPREGLEKSLFDIWFYDLILRSCVQRTEDLTSQREILQRQGKLDKRKNDILDITLRQIYFRFLKYKHHYSVAIKAMPDGPIKKSYRSLRQKRGWYLNAGLIQECAGRDGCCARACGCCERQRTRHDERGGLGLGHCTPDCACCKRVHGVVFNDNQERHSFWLAWLKPFDQELFRRNTYWLKIRQAFFFGVSA